MTNFGDPSFTHHLATALVWSKTAILIATTPVLPYSPRDYANALNRIFSNLQNEYGEVLQEQNISLSKWNCFNRQASVPFINFTMWAKGSCDPHMTTLATTNVLTPPLA